MPVDLGMCRMRRRGSGAAATRRRRYSGRLEPLDRLFVWRESGQALFQRGIGVVEGRVLVDQAHQVLALVGTNQLGYADRPLAEAQAARC